MLRCSRSKAAPAVAAPSCAVADLFSTVEGMKGLFWRREITPAAVADFDLVWLFDNDIAVDEVDLAAVAQTMQRAGVPLLQPRIAYPSGQLHQFHHLQPKPAPPIPDGCTAVSTTYIEVQTPIMAAAAWALYHEHVLQRVPEAVLNVTDWGIADNWCRFLHRAYIAERAQRRRRRRRAAAVRHGELRGEAGVRRRERGRAQLRQQGGAAEGSPRVGQRRRRVARVRGAPPRLLVDVVLRVG